MAQMPKIKGPARRKPLTYDPARDRFITIDDLEAGRAEIFPLHDLTEKQRRQLVAERHRRGDDVATQPMSGKTRGRSQTLREIEEGTEFGRMTVRAEIMYLTELLKQIQAALDADEC